MAKVKGASVIMDNSDGENAEELSPADRRAAEIAELEELDAQEDGDFLRSIEEIASTAGVRIIITRTLPDIPGKKGFVGEMSPSQFNLENLRRRFGPGRYRIRCMGPKGWVRGGGTVDIADSVEPAPGEIAPTGVAGILSAIEEREHARRLASREQTMEYAKLVIPAMAPIVAALLTRKSGNDLASLVALMPKPPTMADNIALMANMKELSGGNSDKVGDFIRALEIAKDMGGGNGGTGWMDVLKEVVGAGKPLLEKVMMSKVTGPILPAPLTATPQSQAAIGQDGALQPQDDQTMMLALLPWLKANLEQLIVQAQRNKDPELYAAVLIDNVPDGVSPDKLKGWLGRDDWWQVLSSFHAGVVPYQGWMTELRNFVLEQIEDASNPSVPENTDGH